MLEEEFIWAESDWLDPQARKLPQSAFQVKRVTTIRVTTSKSIGARPGTSAQAELHHDVTVDRVTGTPSAPELPLRGAHQGRTDARALQETLLTPSRCVQDFRGTLECRGGARVQGGARALARRSRVLRATCSLSCHANTSSPGTPQPGGGPSRSRHLEETADACNGPRAINPGQRWTHSSLFPSLTENPTQAMRSWHRCDACVYYIQCNI